MIYPQAMAARRPVALVAALVLILTALVPRSAVSAQVVQHRITWDAHSILVDGRRVLLYSGEFHYWRLPSPDQWTDRLEKMKAAGLNAVSIYFDWQYHSSAPGQYDFTGIRDVNRLLDITDRLGLYVLARVGPYMNAEADAGGLPGWLLSKQLFPRAQSWSGTVAQAQYSPLYTQYSKEWLDQILPIVARHQATDGKSVLLLQLENEYSQDTGSQQYMQELYGFARADGITVPIFHNDFWFKGDWSKLVDLYAYDSYPYGFACCHQWWDVHFHGIDTWEQDLRTKLGITTPMFVSELQGGSFDPWHGNGYEAVAKTLDGDWLNAIDQSALAQGTTLLNTYMFAGGTSWGYMSEPGVYTSYDYGAPISESGVLRPSFYAAHRLGMFLASYGPVLAGADAAPGLATASNAKIVVHSRLDRESGQGFVFLRHGDPGPSELTRLRLTFGGEDVMVPRRANTSISVPGHGSLLLTTNVQTGPLHLRYSTSQVLADVSTSQGRYLVLHGVRDSDGETSFVRPDTPVSVTHNAGVEVHMSAGEIRLDYKHTRDPRVITLQTTDGTLHVIVTDTDAASRFWYVNHLLISGPDLVTGSEQMHLWSAQPRDARVYGAPSDRSVSIDGTTAAAPDAATGTVLLGRLTASPTFGLPTLTNWKFASEAPEVAPSFDDSSWQVADHASTTNPNVSPGPSLLADDYGFHYGFVWYRGHFTPKGTETSITIAARQSYGAYVNGRYIGGANENLADPPHTYAVARTYVIPPGLLVPGADNVVSVLTESLGHDEGWVAGPAAQSPQGILSAKIEDGSTPIIWRIQGDRGGEQPPDAARGILNASGLYGERNGWYLPDFNDASWSTLTVPDSWRARGVTSDVGWYRTHFSLNLPDDAQTQLGITIPHASDKVVLWVNGWLVGRYWEQRGPQHLFYIPAGLLHPHGDNVLAAAVWNRGHAGGLSQAPVLTAYGSLQDHDLLVNAAPPPAGTGYWHTSGNRIVDDTGGPVRIVAANWFGMENRFYVPAGLDKQPLTAIMTRIRSLGFNTVRLPFSNQMIEDNPVVSTHLDANPDLQGLHALDVLDRIVAEAGRVGLKIILNDGRSSAGTQPQRNGLWYTERYPESSWIKDWETLVNRYNGNSTVIGVDLRNEPHTGPPGPWTVHAYLKQGSTWGPYKGKDDPTSDWRLAAERGGDAVLATNPHLLVFVEGLQLYPDATQPGGIDSYWWGGILTPARQYPVELSVPHQLVYSPHEYGPLKWQMPWFGPHMTYQSVKAVWEKHWGFLEKPTFKGEAPVLIGEFGTCGTARSCVDDSTPGSQGLWFRFLLRYLRSHPEIGWAYWAINGTSHRGDDAKDYILAPDWHTVRVPYLIDALRDLEYAPGPT